jgi:hypothetical protein
VEQRSETNRQISILAQMQLDKIRKEMHITRHLQATFIKRRQGRKALLQKD